MAAPRLKNEDIERAVRLVESMLRKGYAPPGGPGSGTGRKQAILAAGQEAIRLGWARANAEPTNFIRHRIGVAEARGLRGVNWKIKPRKAKTKKPRRAPTPSARVSVPRGPAMAIPKTVRVLVIPDVHLCPSSPDVSRMEWIGRHAAEMDPDEIVQLGDLGTFDSVNRHAQPGTIEHAKNPRVLADFDVLARGLDRFDRGLGRCRARKRITKGNHENRLDRFENDNPQCQGMFADRFDEIANKAGWGVTPFSEYSFIEGVAFIHHAVNGMGRAYGGKTAPSRIANDSTFSIVHGHTHQRHSVAAPKMNAGMVRVISAGCALPQGHIEAYAKHSLTGWSYGVMGLTIRSGQILDEEWISMETLKRRHHVRNRTI